jgi:hypothetical protein
MQLLYLHLIGISLVIFFHGSESFSIISRRDVAGPISRVRRRREHIGVDALFYSGRDDRHYSFNKKGDDDSSFNLAELSYRLAQLRIQNLEEEFRRPPNPHLLPTDFTETCLQCLGSNSDPLPDSGIRLLLRASTTKWRNQILQSIGAPTWAREDDVVSSLSDAIARPNNQFGILVGEGESYVTSYPTDPLEYADDTCWVECQLRDKESGKLLVITGWQLLKENGSWMIDGIDWQDFREAFRPGVGREEWVRICG